jgi:hypothetical protein
MNLIIGQQYKKIDFGISGIVRQWSEITVEGELFTFFSKDSKYENLIEKDGFVYEGRGEYSLIPYGLNSDLHRHVFIHDTANEPYTYLGMGLYEKRYDDKRNKIFFK